MYDKTYWDARRKELALRVSNKKDKTIDGIVAILNEYFSEQNEVVKSLNEINEHEKSSADKVEEVTETPDEEKPARKKAKSD